MAAAHESTEIPDGAVGPSAGWQHRLLALGWQFWLAIVLSSLTLAGGLVVAVNFTATEPEIDLSSAWKQLESEEFAAARQTATVFLDRGGADSQQTGEAAFLIGRCLCGEADSEWNADRRKGLYLVGSRYLQESYNHGFPESSVEEGLYFLALSTFESGHETASLPYWKELEESGAPTFAETLPLYLARIYLADSNLDSKVGLDYINKYLEGDGLLPEERISGTLDKAALLLDVGQWDEGIQLLESFKVTANERPRKRLLLGRLLLAKADALRQSELGNPANADQRSADAANEIYQRAIDELMGVRSTLTEGAEESNQSIFFLARCYQRLGDLEKAEFHYSEVRRDELIGAIGWAAGIEEAYLQYLQGDMDATVQGLIRVFSSDTAPEPYDNPWIDRATVTTRLEEILNALIDRARLDDANRLAKTLWPPLPRDFSMEWQGKIQKQWGQRLVDQAERLRREGDSSYLAMKKEGLSHLRLAGDAFSKLASLRKSFRNYADYLWEAASAFSGGHDYAKAIRIYEKLLEENPSNLLARLYLKLGEAYFAQGDNEEALTNLSRGVRERPNDPDSYKSRLLASQIHMSQHEMAVAKQLLLDNLEQELLSPESIDSRESLFALSRALFQEASMLEAESRAMGVDGDDPKRVAAGLDKLEECFLAFQETTRRLEEGLQRYRDDLPMFEQRYLLAESYRMSALWPRKKAFTVTVTSTRYRLEAEADDYLGKALDLYSDLMADLSSAQDTRPLSSVETGLLRNCYFFRADMLFELNELPQAIEAYKSAANRFHDRPESLEAFVRLASCYRRMERYDDARGVLAQAKLFLQDRIPPTSDYTQTTRYSRDEWVTFLDFLIKL